LKNRLIEQSYQASEYIRRLWPVLLFEAQKVFHSMDKGIERILICGCGDSHHAALGLEMGFELWTECRVRSASAMSAGRYLLPRWCRPAETSLLIGISASGEVARTIEAVELARSMGVRTLAFTSNADSLLGRISDFCIVAPIPPLSGPGLLSYLASLLMGYATCAALSREKGQGELYSCMEELSDRLQDHIICELDAGVGFAESLADHQIVFVGGGPLIGSAMFSAAKVIESAGAHAWAQEVEEWAHLEYFCDPAGMATWFLSAEGRTMSRERELIEAARTIGRHLIVSQWQGGKDWSASAREALAPLALWPGPVGFAVKLADKLGQEPFRGFSGGRSPEEGGGASRIRSSLRWSRFDELNG
jgi:glucosamine--fructose-6-phosphate aminotransferase (isomerizing)